MPTYICYLGKAYLMYGIAGVHYFINVWLLGPRLDWEKYVSTPIEPEAVRSKYSLSVSLFVVATSLVFVSRYVSNPAANLPRPLPFVVHPRPLIFIDEFRPVQLAD